MFNNFYTSIFGKMDENDEEHKLVMDIATKLHVTQNENKKKPY